MSDKPDIASEWADDYPEGAELFCASFDADDFDTFYGDGYPDGTTVAVLAFRRPPQGWIIANAGLDEITRTRSMLERHCRGEAFTILTSLCDDRLDEFVNTWMGVDAGKSRASSKRSRGKKTP